jgi:hypothetical protein
MLDKEIQRYRELSRQIMVLDKERKELGKRLAAQMPTDRLCVPGYTARRYHRWSIKTPLEEARSLGATHMEETLDKVKLRALYEAGHTVSGVSPYTVVQIFDTARAPAPPPLDSLCLIDSYEHSEPRA